MLIPVTLDRCDHLDPPIRHVTIPVNSHMTHTLRKSTRRPLTDGYTGLGDIRSVILDLFSCEHFVGTFAISKLFACKHLVADKLRQCLYFTPWRRVDINGARDIEQLR